MEREARRKMERIKRKPGQKDAYLTHGCGFADEREDLVDFPIGEGISLPLVWNSPTVSEIS